MFEKITYFEFFPASDAFSSITAGEEAATILRKTDPALKRKAKTGSCYGFEFPTFSHVSRICMIYCCPNNGTNEL